MSKEKKRYVRIMKGVPEFMYMDENTARMIAGKGGWIPSPEPQKIEKEVWTPETVEDEPETVEPEEDEEIDLIIRAEEIQDFNNLVEKLVESTETPVVKRGRKPKQ